MIKTCNHLEKKESSNISEEERFQTNLIGYCNRRDIMVNERFCQYCNRSRFGSPCCRSPMKWKQTNWGVYYVCLKCNKRVNDKVLEQYFLRKLEKEESVLKCLDEFENKGENKEVKLNGNN